MSRAFTPVLVFIAIVVSSCSLISGSGPERESRASFEQSVWAPVQPERVNSKNAPPSYREAVAQLVAGHDEQALQEFDRFRAQNPASRWSLAALVSSAIALQAQGRWSEATVRYREAVVASEEIAFPLQMAALNGLASCYEALGDDQADIATLRDILAKNQSDNPARSLPAEFIEAELPGRLAGAYARIGNFDQAIFYYKQAETGLGRLRKNSGARAPEWLGQTLYLIGRITVESVSWDNLDSVFRVLSRSQVALLQAAELGQAPWAEKASQDLLRIYRDVWTAILNPPKPVVADPNLHGHDLERQQWDWTGLLLEKLRELQAYELPPEAVAETTPIYPADTSPANSAQARAVYDFSRVLEKQIHDYLSIHPVGEDLTEESLKKRAKIQARTLSPDSTLEGEYEHGRASKTGPPVKKPSGGPGAPSKDDPNL